MAALHTDAIYVVFTTVDETLAAARAAHALGQAMAAPLTLIVLRPSARPLSMKSLTEPTSLEVEALAANLNAEGIDVRVRSYIYRDEQRAIPMAFKRRSLIVIAGRRHWWPTQADRWRRKLEAAGHFVVFVGSDTLAGERRETVRA